MKILLLSDLHLETAYWSPLPTNCDVVVLAGDIHTKGRGAAWAREEFPGKPVIYVAGNHEYYGADKEAAGGALRSSCADHGIHFLDRGELVIDGVRFLGCTLWTDYRLDAESDIQVAHNMRFARTSISDHARILYGDGHFLPEHAALAHAGDVSWLRERLAEPWPGRTVVVTHHLPLRASIANRWRLSPLNSAFASDLPELVRAPVDVWAHGHTHDSADYFAGGTRVVCNPRGYVPYEPNAEFDPTFTVEV